jgi:hypothetical protein
MQASRLTQPYRRGTRNPSPALTAMTRGRTFAGTNPQQAKHESAAEPVLGAA